MKRTLKLAAILIVNLMAIEAQGTTSPKMPTFFARRDYPGLFNNYLQVADTNGDGITDMISSQNGAINVRFGNGDGTFRPGPTTANVSWFGLFFVAVDLNGDGKTDLVFANSGIVVSIGNGDGTFQHGVSYPNGDDVVTLAVGDFNGDGILDIAAAGNVQGVWLFTGKGAGTFNSAVLAVSLPG